MDLSKKRQIITTNDGSHSILVSELNEQYHSKHGALQEAQHVFSKMGLDQFLTQDDSSINVFEVGFGTGLNALITARWATANKKKINYTSIERYPISKHEFQQLNFGQILEEKYLYQKITSSKWNDFVKISNDFKLRKLKLNLLRDDLPSSFDLIFFDAFAPNKQPELWTESIFKKIFNLMNNEAILVTYCCQGQAKRNMISAGLTVEKVPGPPGKREMLRAIKL